MPDHPGIWVPGFGVDEGLHRPPQSYPSPAPFLPAESVIFTRVGRIATRDVLDYPGTVARIWGFEVTACRVWEDEEKLQAAPKAFLAALRRGRRARLRLFDVMAFHIGIFTTYRF
jgi:hypothetical protein